MDFKFVLLSFLFVSFSCGIKGPPLPPLSETPPTTTTVQLEKTETSVSKDTVAKPTSIDKTRKKVKKSE